jgi:hypothetical protein
MFNRSAQRPAGGAQRSEPLGIPARPHAVGASRELACEINLLVGPDDATVPLFDTPRLHARRDVELALS